jgi:hypothetical protein
LGAGRQLEPELSCPRGSELGQLTPDKPEGLGEVIKWPPSCRYCENKWHICDCHTSHYSLLAGVEAHVHVRLICYKSNTWEREQRKRWEG